MELKIDKTMTINLEVGRTYSLISNIVRLDKNIYELNPLVRSLKILTPLDVSIFNKKRETLMNFLKKYNFSYEEITKIKDNLNISEDMNTYSFSAKIRGCLLVEIQLKYTDVIIINIAGYSYATAKFLYQYLLNKILNTRKIALCIEYVNYNAFILNKIDIDLINNYEIWIKDLQQEK